MLSGFFLAAYSTIANDVIQTLGTFLSSNHRTPWWILWLFAAGILTLVLLVGWYWNSGDAAYGRLAAVPLPAVFSWWHAAPPLLLLVLTRYGFPVSTTFLILSVFTSTQVMTMIVLKSMLGYGVAFGSALLAYGMLASKLEARFLRRQTQSPRLWIALQWISTGFLWSQWLIQDLANIFVFVPRKQQLYEIAGAIVLLTSLMAVLFWQRGGRVQQVVLSKTNTTDIRSATIIDFIYGLVLFYFKELNNLPMSTTWVFVGLLAGREIGLVWRLGVRPRRELVLVVMKDLAKVTTGLVASVLLIYFIRLWQ